MNTEVTGGVSVTVSRETDIFSPIHAFTPKKKKNKIK